MFITDLATLEDKFSMHRADVGVVQPDITVGVAADRHQRRVNGVCGHDLLGLSRAEEDECPEGADACWIHL